MKLRCLAEHSVAEGPILCVASSAAGIVSVGADGTIALSSVATSRRTGAIKPQRRWERAAVDPVGALVALGGDTDHVSLASIEGGVHRSFFATGHGLLALVFVDSGRTLIGADHKSVYRWDVAFTLAGGGEVEDQYHQAIYSISDHATRGALLVGTIGGVDQAFGEPVTHCDHQGDICVLAVADAGDHRALFGGERAYAADIVTMVRQVNEGDHGVLFAVDMSTRTVVSTTTPEPVTALRGIPDRHCMAVGCLDGELLIVDSRTLERRASVQLAGDETLTDLELPSGHVHQRRSPTGGIAIDGAGVLWVGTGSGILVAYALLGPEDGALPGDIL